MKKILCLALTLCFCLVVAAGCGEKNAPGELNITKMTAEEIAREFKEAGFPVGKVVVCTEETDENELMGRPNQYISETNFEDTRLEQTDEIYMAGGTIEVFNNQKDAITRKNYIESVYEKMPILSEYLYHYENVLVRFAKALTPDQAKEYETAFKSLCTGKKPDKVSIAPASPSSAVQSSAPPASSTPEAKTYGIGEPTDILDEGKKVGVLTINSVTASADRNQFDESNPAQVFIINYTYENTASEEDLYIFDMHFQVVDSQGNVCSSYPLTDLERTQKTPIGAKCTAEQAYGSPVENASIKMNFNLHSYGDDPATRFELAFS